MPRALDPDDLWDKFDEECKFPKPCGRPFPAFEKKLRALSAEEEKTAVGVITNTTTRREFLHFEKKLFRHL